MCRHAARPDGVLRVVDPAAGFATVKEMALTEWVAVSVADLDGDAVDDIALSFNRSPTQIFLSTTF